MTCAYTNTMLVCHFVAAKPVVLLRQSGDGPLAGQREAPPPELGGQGHGQLKLSLLNEILGRSSWAPVIFGCQAPDTGNAEILAHYGTEEQKERYLRPLLDGEIFSCYSMTEPQAGSDPTLFETRATRDGDEWVIEGWKFFSSNARTAAFLIVMAVTDPEVSAYQGMSMFLVPTDAPGVVIEPSTRERS